MKSAVTTDQAPAAIGPYSQALRVDRTLYCSGQVALDPKTGALVAGGIEAETKQVLANLDAVLTAGGSSWAHVIKTTIYLTDLGDFATVNRLYGERVTAPPPARATVQVSALPKGAVVEIDAIAHVPG